MQEEEVLQGEVDLHLPAEVTELVEAVLHLEDEVKAKDQEEEALQGEEGQDLLVEEDPELWQEEDQVLQEEEALAQQEEGVRQGVAKW